MASSVYSKTSTLLIVNLSTVIVRRNGRVTDQTVKFWPMFSYLIVHDPVMQPPGIARILHASQDLKAMFRRRLHSSPSDTSR